MRSAVKPSLEVTDDGRWLGSCLMFVVDLGIDKVNRIFRVDECANKIGTESEAIDLAEGVYMGKADSHKFSSRLWLGQLIRYPLEIMGMLIVLDPLMINS
jgi:hypothetical protein